MGCKPSPSPAATRQQNHPLTAVPSSMVLPGADFSSTWLLSEVSATADTAGVRGWVLHPRVLVVCIASTALAPPGMSLSIWHVDPSL